MHRSIFIIAMASAALLTFPAFAKDNELVKYCKTDIQRLCNTVKPGDGRILACLKAHKKEMTVGCAQALQKLQSGSKN